MNGVYGRKQKGGCETFMDRFVELEPSGGFQSIVELAWSRDRDNHTNGAQPGARLNGHPALASVYGLKHLNGDVQTWMDRFVTLEPEGGFRSVLKLSLDRLP